jgi:sugar phosphate permease
MSHAHSNGTQVAPPETPLATVLGWIAVAFGILPLLMGIAGDGRSYLVVGVVLITAGIVSILIGRNRSRKLSAS